MKNICTMVSMLLVSLTMMAQEFTFTNSVLPNGWSATNTGSSKFSDETPVLKIPDGNTLTYTFNEATNLTSIDFIYSFGSKTAGLYVTLTAKDANGNSIGTAQLTQASQQSGSNVKQTANVTFAFNAVKSIEINNATGKNFLIGYIKFNSGSGEDPVDPDPVDPDPVDPDPVDPDPVDPDPVDPQGNYMSSIFIDQLVLDNGVKYDIKSAFTAHNISCENINDLDSLNDSKTARNEPYLGLKIKKTGGNVSGWLKAGSTIKVKFGYVAATVNVTIGTASPTELSPSSNKLAVWEHTANADELIKIATTTDKTVVLKQIAIDEDVKEVTLPESPDPETPDPVDPENPPTLNIHKIELSAFTKTDNTYEATFEEIKAIGFDLIYVELPSTDDGTITFKGSSKKDDRFIYIYESNGATKSDSRKIVMANGYATELAFTEADILTEDGKYYLVFGTTDDFKFKGVKYTIGSSADPEDPEDPEDPDPEDPENPDPVDPEDPENPDPEEPENPNIPATDLTLHTPDVYVETYKGKLSVVDGRYYEVYYATYDEQSHYQVAVTPVQKTNGITETTSDNYSCKAKDGWFEVKGSTSKSNYTMTAKDEFKAGESGCHKIYNNGYYKLHIQGFDQFSFFGKDNSTTISDQESKNKRFQVYIDGKLQAETQMSTDDKIRRYNISEGEHVIEVRGIGGSNNYFYGFSLRETNAPRVKYYDGNDTTQHVLVTQALKPVEYSLKNGKAEGAKVELKWDGNEAKGIGLEFNDAQDTVRVSGIALCEAGEYTYSIVATQNGKVTGKVSGKFFAETDIKAETDTIIDAYVGEEVEALTLRYYAIDASGISVVWKDDKIPAGFAFKDNKSTHKYVGGGILTEEGTYRFTITIAGNTETVITGSIDVIKQDLGTDPILYLYRDKGLRKTGSADIKEGVFEHLKSKSFNVQARRTMAEVRKSTFYQQFKAIVISEDVSADNEEVLGILKGEAASLPILNMKGFTYAREQLDWGHPDNGTVDTTQNSHSGSIFIQRAEHPIFSSFSGKNLGDEIKILDAKELKREGINGVMPIKITSGGVCLATAYTRNMESEKEPIESYYEDGDLQTIIHEIPVTKAGEKKYICLPLSLKSLKYLTNDGKKLIEGVMSYLLSDEEVSFDEPELGITKFSIDGENAEIDQKNNLIQLTLTDEHFEELDHLREAKPIITLADADLTYVTPGSREIVSLEYAQYMTYKFVVSDYIRQRVYEFSLSIEKTQGIDDVYAEGDWVNIFDIYGRKVATTNENIYTMELPRGVYIAVTAGGQTIKILK